MAAAAPFYGDVADGPPGAEAEWLTASDGVRLRAAYWPDGGKGTVLLFPGRTEYIEKYGATAGDFAELGYAMAAIDWRGQGLADRALDDRNTGHVMHFSDYQMDVAAMLDAVSAHGLPEPYYLVAHSMGGAIGLRACMQGLPVRAAVFSAPMWGIAITGLLRPVAWSLSWASRRAGFGHRYAPGTKPETYVRDAAFEGNVLTTDRSMFEAMLTQVTEHPDLALGGPSLHWLYEALRETRAMAREPSPDIPVLTWVGSNERVVDTAPIRVRMAHWPGGKLEVVEGAEHEVLMETPATRARIFSGIGAHFAASS
ncbi:MAG: alpha/beta hydrolase [Rhodobacter sp.]|nr:alpha/beta hydrolase [Rhodobacter sp.]